MNRRNESITLLMCDDDKDDCMLTRDALEESRLLNTLNFVHDGEQLLDYLHQRNEFTDVRQSPKPDLILLDLNMPVLDGHGVMERLSRAPELANIPVVVLTVSDHPDDIRRSYLEGAASYVAKPVTLAGIARVIAGLNGYALTILRES